jgi:hypothetical protein
MDINVQTLYSIVNNSVSNVVHNRIDSTEFKLPTCRYNLMSCSSSMPLETRSSWCWFCFLIFYMWRTCWQLQLLFYDKNLILLQKFIKNMSKLLYVNDSLLYRSSRVTLYGTTRPGGPVQMGDVARLSCATLSCTTDPGLPELRGHVAWLVAPIRVARLGQDLLSQPNPWRDWESRHRVWHDS